jgi:hypothetical protein
MQNGRIGASPRETRHDFDDEATAQRYSEKLIAEKLKKGYVEGAIAAAPAHQQPVWAEMMMDEDVFWRIIKLFNWKKLGDDDAVLEPAIKALSKMSIDDIKRFEDIMTEKLHALDSRAHAKAGMFDDFFSDDGFLYQRCVVVANGKQVFEEILADPDQMPQDSEFECLLYLAGSAYERKTGEEFDYSSPLSYESGHNEAGWEKEPQAQ